MKMRHIALTLAAILLPLCSFAQKPIEPEPDDHFDYDVRSGLSATAVWRVSDKVALDAGYLMLTTDNVSRIFRNQLSIGASYTPWKFFKTGGGYAYLMQYSHDGAKRPKHRVYCFVEGNVKAGGWKFSLYEKFQFTHNAYETNPYSKERNSLDMKTRLKAAYTDFKFIEPYIQAELWNCLNSPSVYADYNYTTKTYLNYQFLGYNDAYITRLRGVLGIKWKISKQHSIDFSYMHDLSRNKRIKVDPEGTTLQSFKWDKTSVSNFSLGYLFVF